MSNQETILQPSVIFGGRHIASGASTSQKAIMEALGLRPRMGGGDIQRHLAWEFNRRLEMQGELKALISLGTELRSGGLEIPGVVTTNQLATDEEYALFNVQRTLVYNTLLGENPTSIQIIETNRENLLHLEKVIDIETVNRTIGGGIASCADLAAVFRFIFNGNQNFTSFESNVIVISTELSNPEGNFDEELATTRLDQREGSTLKLALERFDTDRRRWEQLYGEDNITQLDRATENGFPVINTANLHTKQETELAAVITYLACLNPQQLEHAITQTNVLPWISGVENSRDALELTKTDNVFKNIDFSRVLKEYCK